MSRRKRESMKRRILFVDDEPNVLDGLRRMLRAERARWDMSFAENADEALREMHAPPVCLVPWRRTDFQPCQALITIPTCPTGVLVSSGWFPW